MNKENKVKRVPGNVVWAPNVLILLVFPALSHTKKKYIKPNIRDPMNDGGVVAMKLR